MNIEQVLRDAIEHKTAKILKEEYGLDWTPIPPDEQGKDPNYQVTLLDSGDGYEDVIDFITSILMIEPSYAKALVDHAPSVIKTGLCKEAAIDINKDLLKLGASSSVEKVVSIDVMGCGTNLQNKKSTTLRNEEVSYNADVIEKQQDR